MEDQYGGVSDLRHYIDGRPLFPAISQPSSDFQRAMTSSHPYDMLVFRSDSTTAQPSAAVGYEAEAIGGGAGRWPRQETLTLLEIRSRLDPKFKEANQKGPLWDEVSRILWEEHGYERSGKKCREKFENLYKYYKKTKEGKGGRQDGKHYRFFRQLEALYGDHNTNINNSATLPIPHFHNFPTTCCDQEPYPPETSIPDSCESYCSESNAGDDDARMKKIRIGKRSLKAKIEASIDAQMKEMMQKQEAWMEKMTLVIEGKEEERLLREEQWRKQDAARIYGEQKMWASERAWVEARDAALMDAFNRLAGKELHQLPPPPPPVREGGVMWPELRSGMELRFGENGIMSPWDEMSGGGSGREKWDHAISDYLIKCSKKRKENAKASAYAYQNRDPISDHGVARGEGAMPLHGGGNRSSGDTVNDGLFRYFIEDSYQRYYDLK